MKILLLSVIGLIALCSSAFGVTPAEKAKINCFIRQLKNLNKLEETYAEYSVTEEGVNCDKEIKDLKTTFYSKLAVDYRDKHGINEIIKCVKADIKDTRWFHNVMKVRVLKASETMTEKVKEQTITDLRKQIRASIHESMEMCQYHEGFGKIFDNVFVRPVTADEEATTNKMADYCSKKIVLDGHLLDTKVYHVELNPHNLAVDGIDCTKTLKDITANLRKTLTRMLKANPFGYSTEKANCIYEKFRDGNYINRMLLLNVLRRLKITEQQKEAERKSFVDAMVYASHSSETC